MILFPAIDLKDGKCVRLYQGDMEKVTTFSNSPSTQALMFAKEGAQWIHVVDLDGAFAGESRNREAVEDIIKVLVADWNEIKDEKVKIQLGGGIRTLEAVDDWLNVVDRVILGTAAVKNPQLVIDACKLVSKYPNKEIAVGIDAKDGFVATEGWAEKTKVSVIELAKKFEDAGVACIIYTDISKDGAMQGADFEGTRELVKSVNIPIILSGGISSKDDLRKAKDIAGLYGVISGRAIYEKAFSVKEAIEILK
jgi:phosphoribosylformimino-5-aminoimidazole carboxamide ribotide isomerase